MTPDPESRASQRARRQADARLVTDYHREQLEGLFEHLRAGFAHFDAGEIDAFELDSLIHRYSMAAKEVWKFCGNGGARIEWGAHAIRYAHDSGRQPDWWDLVDPDRRRRERHR